MLAWSTGARCTHLLLEVLEDVCEIDRTMRESLLPESAESEAAEALSIRECRMIWQSMIESRLLPLRCESEREKPLYFDVHSDCRAVLTIGKVAHELDRDRWQALAQEALARRALDQND